MTTTTPNLGLTLYDSSTDTSVTFATFRATWGGPASTSNFYKIDTAYGTQASQITALQNTRGAIPVPALFNSANFYTATGISTITAYTAGMTILLSLDTTSNGTVTLNINSLGILSVMKVDSTGTPINLTGSDLVKGRKYLFMYDGSRWLWVSANSADQIQIVGTSGNVVTVGSTNNLDGSLTQSLLISNTLHAATAKTTLVDADEFAISDSAASNILKKITWTNFQTAIGTGIGAVIAALTGKTTPVDADTFVIADSAASNASKSLTLGNLKSEIISTNLMLPNGEMYNGIISPTVTSNNLTLALKYKDGSDPSSTKPVYIYIGGGLRTITSALSVTVNAGTNTSNAGATEFAGLEHDRFAYLRYNATDGVCIGHSRYPAGKIYSDFSATATNEKYAAWNTIANATAGDECCVIGRFAATLSGTPDFNWSVPSYTPINLIQSYVYNTRRSLWSPTLSGFSSRPTLTVYEYVITNNFMEVFIAEGGDGTSNATTYTYTAPFTAATLTNMGWIGFGRARNNSTAITSTSALFIATASNSILVTPNPSDASLWTASGGKRVNAGYLKYAIG